MYRYVCVYIFVNTMSMCVLSVYISMYEYMGMLRAICNVRTWRKHEVSKNDRDEYEGNAERENTM